MWMIFYEAEQRTFIITAIFSIGQILIYFNPVKDSFLFRQSGLISSSPSCSLPS